MNTTKHVWANPTFRRGKFEVVTNALLRIVSHCLKSLFRWKCVSFLCASAFLASYIHRVCLFILNKHFSFIADDSSPQKHIWFSIAISKITLNTMDTILNCQSSFKALFTQSLCANIINRNVSTSPWKFKPIICLRVLY